jgi:dipeptidyl aminopeptidase/acylaminoacyl peptidase
VVGDGTRLNHLEFEFSLHFRNRLDVNYGGSYGYGRAYTQRLASRWGIVDVEDCILASRTLSSPPYSLIDPKRVVIRGQSAGGYTVLAALSISSDTRAFAAATSSYGISNFKMLAEFTHKFESKYLDKLIGGSYDDVPEVYEERSPINHADKIVAPLLVCLLRKVVLCSAQSVAGVDFTGRY